MNFEHRIRASARKILPQSVRRPLGSFCGGIRAHVFYPLCGLIFDLSGGRFRADGCIFVIPQKITSFGFRACFLLRTYEAEERELVRKYILPEDSVLELGACLGIVSCITNKLLKDATRHVVVEANPYCLPSIHENRRRNGATFLVEHCAVSSRPEVTFFINPTHITGSGVSNRSDMAVRLPGRSLKELVDRYPPFSVLIMDIEGSELELLEISADFLKKFRLVIIELHEHAIGLQGVNRCREILQQAGLRLADRAYISEAWVRD